MEGVARAAISHQPVDAVSAIAPDVREAVQKAGPAGDDDVAVIRPVELRFVKLEAVHYR